ncbi:MAG: hypothetical protein ACOCXP_03825 [Candidatus Dojkabacteria bacterium]
MDKTQYLKLVVGAPTSHEDAIRDALAKAGAGQFGNYSNCSFTTQEGTGRFLPNEDANPAIGNVGEPGQVREVRIHVSCEEKILEKVVEELKKVHPYEELPLEVYRLYQRPFINRNE